MPDAKALSLRSPSRASGPPKDNEKGSSMIFSEEGEETVG